MSIAKMKRLTLVANKSRYNEILKQLQKISAVHIIEGSVEELERICDNKYLDIEQKLSEIKNAHDFLKKYDKSKKSLIQAKPAVSAKKLDDFIKHEKKAAEIIKETNLIEEQLVLLRSQKTRIINKINALKPYIKFDAPLEALSGTSKTKMFLGVLNSTSQNVIYDIKDKYAGLVAAENYGNYMEYLPVFVAAHQSAAQSVLNDLKSAGFSEFLFDDKEGVPEDIIYSLEHELNDIDNRIQDTQERTESLLENMEILQNMEDYYSTELERAHAINLLSGTEKTFFLEGWIIAGSEKKVEDAVLKVTDQYYIDFRDPYDDEQFPVALINNRIIRPFEAVTDMYSAPDPRGIDPSSAITPFYFIFFGMMVSDAGYGIVLSLLAIFLLKKIKPEGMFKKILGIVGICGISTLIWGSLYGGWFGFELPPLWFNPLKEPMTMMILCMVIGFIHVLTGLVIAAVMYFKRGDWKSAVFDKILWIILIIGLPLLAFGGVLSTVGTYMSLIGAVGILLTNGRGKKGVIRKLTGGFSSLYGISGFLSDIFSYMRLFGMGLATGVIAMVFNTIAGLLKGQWYGWIFAAAVFLAGHAFNIGINALGAYVQSCRLMYIEFFSKFYEYGGKPYKPLAIKLRHYRLEN